jgi:transcriptional/translational regulatory protein YebC/TACO1
VEAFEAVREAIEKQGIPMLSAQVTMVPSTTVTIEDEDVAAQIVKLMDALEDNDDVQNVYANFDIPDAIMEKVGG